MRLGPVPPGLGWSLGRCGPATGKSGERGPPAGSDLRPLIRRQGASSAHHPSVRIPASSDSGSGEATSKRKRPAVGDGSAPLFCFGVPASGAQPARVAGFPCGSPAPSSSATVPDTSFPTTCFARVVSYFSSFAGGGPLLLLGQFRDRWRAPLEILTELSEIYLAFLEVTHYYQQSVQIALVSPSKLIVLWGLTTLEVF